MYMDLNLQYVHHDVTYGIYVTNVFDDYRSEPGVNQDWQPVATGVGGAQTGQYANAYPYLLSGGGLVANPLYQAGGVTNPASINRISRSHRRIFPVAPFGATSSSLSVKPLRSFP